MDERRRRRWRRKCSSTRDAALERAARGLHAPESEIHSQARVAHAPAHGCRMAEVQTADESGDTQEHGGGARGWRWLLEMRRSDFEKIKAKNSRKGRKEAPMMPWNGGCTKCEWAMLLLNQKVIERKDRASEKADKASKEASKASVEVRLTSKETEVTPSSHEGRWRKLIRGERTERMERDRGVLFQNKITNL